MKQVGNSGFVFGFKDLAEYRDFITIIIGALMFGGRELYQFKRDKERLGALEQSREKDSKIISEIAASQAEMSQAFRLFCKSYERDEERLDRRISRIETGGKQ